MFDPNGTSRRQTFEKTKISDHKFRYDASLNIVRDNGLYVLIDKMDGYTITYRNTGKYAGRTDKLFNGGTAIISQVPKTGDVSTPWLWLTLLCACVLGAIGLSVMKRRGKKAF